MRIIPVIDLLRGEVVRGVAGNRDLYRPIQSALVDNSSPGPIAAALAALPGIEEIYVADLDAIGGAPPDRASLLEIAQCGLPLWVDAGLRDRAAAQALLDIDSRGSAFGGVVVGLETAGGPEFLAEMLAIAGSERAVLSLDLKAGQPLAQSACWRGRSPIQIADEAFALGYRRLIVLDLASVGAYDGGSQLELVAALRAAHSELEMISGGGIRDSRDLERFAAAGCSAVLVASALHDLRLTGPDIAAARLL